jgi:hypothetical protein
MSCRPPKNETGSSKFSRIGAGSPPASQQAGCYTPRLQVATDADLTVVPSCFWGTTPAAIDGLALEIPYSPNTRLRSHRSPATSGYFSMQDAP